MPQRPERRRHWFAFALVVVASTVLTGCSLDFHRFVPPDGDADAGDATIEARLLDAITDTPARLAASRRALEPRSC